MWKGVEKAAINAVRYPNKQFKYGRLRYIYKPDVLSSLFCILPDDSFIQYSKCRVEELQTNFGTKIGVTYLKASIPAAADAKEWTRGTLYGGLLCENATQATAAVLLRDAISKVDGVIAHIHDELVLEAPKDKAHNRRSELQTAMETVPEWADELPLDAKVSVMDRYGKD